MHQDDSHSNLSDSLTQLVRLKVVGSTSVVILGALRRRSVYR